MMKEMKKILYILTILFLVGCAKQELMSGVVEKSCEEKVVANDGFTALLEQARWGDGKACLKLAEFYHDGVGVKPDFVNSMTMLAMADQYGEIRGFDDFIKSLPEMDYMRLMYNTFEKPNLLKSERADSIVNNLLTNDSADGYVFKGVVQIERGDTLEGMRSIETGVDMGSSFGALLLCILPDANKLQSSNLEMLQTLSDRIPMVNKILGDYYSGYEGVQFIDEPLAVKYYMKADEKGCLGKRPARWLINYYDRKGIQIDAREMERLQILSGNRAGSDEFFSDSVKVDIDCIEIDTLAMD